ncbi:MAG: thiamine pyrophosphate-binding protein [Deltaproteobacteria bacterium]|nr:thiamine pyrophosphate-binding protein [Deltaproteobacteria bacterium]
MPKNIRGIGAVQDTFAYQIDISNSFSDMEKYVANIEEEKTFLQEFKSAIEHLLKTGDKGPVLLNITSDVFLKKIKHNLEDTAFSFSRPVDENSASFAIEKIRKAGSAVIFAGAGVKLSDAYNELQELSDILKVPVITSPKGKAVFNNESPLYLGSFGAGSNIIPKTFLKNEKIDVLLAIGTSFNEFSSNCWADEIKNIPTIIQIDIDPKIIGRAFSNTYGVVGDIKATLTHINKKIESLPAGALNHLNANKIINRYKSEFTNFERPEWYNSEATPIKIPRLLKDIREGFTEDNVTIYNDNGSCIFWTNHYLMLRKGWNFESSLGFCSMGYAFPAAIGGYFGAPKRTHIAIAGDGSVIMNGNELKTASEYNALVFFIVFNDGAHGVVKHSTELLFNRALPGTAYKKIDFVQFANNFGVEGYRIDKPGQINKKFIQELQKKNKPILFDCRVDSKDIGPYGERIKQVASQLSNNA